MKPVIVGMNNPHSGDPKYALYPHPENSAGARLCSMFLAEAAREKITADKMDYIGGFDRMNLTNTPTWDPVTAEVRAHELKDKLRGKRVILCGVSVLKAFKLKRREWLVWSEKSLDLFKDPFDYVLIPHPSGLCREYNDPKIVRNVGKVLVNEWKRANGDPRT